MFFQQQAAICRSAQPLAGLNTRSSEDEQMLQAIVRSNPASTDMYIIDTRPKVIYQSCHLSLKLSASTLL